MDYPKEYHNLLIQVGLIKKGTVELHGVVSDSKMMRLDEKSSTWTQGSNPTIDYREATCYMCPTSDGNSVLGAWEQGQTKDVIKIINEECNVPLSKGDRYPIELHHGQKFDLSNPVDCAMWRLAVHQDHIAQNLESVNVSHTHYWYNVEDAVLVKRKYREDKMKAFALASELSLTVKREILSVLFFDKNLGYPDFSESELEVQFMDYADTDSKAIVTIAAMQDLKVRVLVIKAENAGGLLIEGRTGKITYPDNRIVSNSFEELVKELSTNKDLLKEVTIIAEQQKSAFANGGNLTNDVAAIEQTVYDSADYDTTIYSLEQVSRWGIEVCRLYLAENNVPFNELASIEDLRKEVVSTYKSIMSFEDSPIDEPVKKK